MGRAGERQSTTARVSRGLCRHDLVEPREAENRARQEPRGRVRVRAHGRVRVRARADEKDATMDVVCQIAVRGT